MKTLVIYDTTYGSTEKIAQAIGNAIGSKVLKADQVNPVDLTGVDLLIVGSPTHGGLPTEGIHSLLKQSLALEGVNVVAFDTRTQGSPFGYAAPRIAKRLQRNGGKLIAPPEGFLVKGMKDPLKGGELERAARWAEQIAGM